MTVQENITVPRKKKKKKNYLLRIVLFLVLFLCVYKLAMLGKEPTKTEIIRYGTLEDKINTDGYVMRYEYVIDSPVSGMLSCVAGEGERVNKDSKVATVFEGNVDENLQSKITRINERILELERSEIKNNLVIGDIVQIDTVIARTVEDVIKSTYDGDMEKISHYKNDLSKVITQRMKEKGEEVPKISKKDELIAEKKKLEASAGTNRFDIVAPIAGVYSSVIDGYEKVFDLSNRIMITPDMLAKADQAKKKQNDSVLKGEGVIKIIDNYEWYYAATVDSRWIKDLKVGSYIMLRFPEISGKSLDANVDSISEERDGKVTIVVACSQYENNIYSARKVNCDIIRKTYNGFKVPKSSVRVLDDGSNGVYIIKDGIAAFRKIEVLHSNDEYVIAKENNKLDKALLLYDEVIVSGSDIEDGKLVR